MSVRFVVSQARQSPRRSIPNLDAKAFGYGRYVYNFYNCYDFHSNQLFPLGSLILAIFCFISHGILSVLGLQYSTDLHGQYRPLVNCCVVAMYKLTKCYTNVCVLMLKPYISFVFFLLSFICMSNVAKVLFLNRSNSN